MAIAMGTRSAFGLFVSPINTASGMGLAALSLALALGQLALGFSQPLIGSLADRLGAAKVIFAGAWLMAAATALPAIVHWPLLVAASLIVSAVAGSAVGSNGLLVGEVTRVAPAASGGLVVGVIGAGASVGQLLLGPVAQWTIGAYGWAAALVAMAAFCLVALPLALPFRRAPQPRSSQPVAPIGDALRQWSFWRVALSFGVCGFHIAFLNVHMPGVIERCGLPASLAGTWIAVSGAANIAGSILVGFALKRRDAGWLLVVLYAVRAAAITALLVAPVSSAGMLLFGVVMGASYMATLPPTAQLVAREHGVARLGTLFGVVMLVHQVGSFLGIWLGGWAAEATGSDTLAWTVDIVLALVACALIWPMPQRAPGGGRLAGARS
jgi:predicted MFS family arabinose efflux permease